MKDDQVCGTRYVCPSLVVQQPSIWLGLGNNIPVERCFVSLKQKWIEGQGI